MMQKSPSTFSTIHRVQVEIPFEVFDKFGHTKEYTQRALDISRQSMVATSGQDSYGKVFEWAEDSDFLTVGKFSRLWEEYIKELEKT